MISRIPKTSIVKVIRKLADESVVNNTLQDDDELFLSVAPGEIWEILLVLIIVKASDASDPDAQFAWTLPAGATLSQAILGYNITTAGGDNNTRYLSKFQSVTALNIGIVAIASASVCTIHGLYIGGATGGNLQLQWAQAATQAGNAVTVKADSYLKATKVG